MPDMSKPGAHYADLMEWLKYSAIKCYDESKTLITRGQAYDEASQRLQSAIDKEKDIAAANAQEPT